jgi:hypothetical protein
MSNDLLRVTICGLERDGICWLGLTSDQASDIGFFKGY